MRRLLRDVAGASTGSRAGEGPHASHETADTTTLEDFGVLAKLRAVEEDE